MVLTYAMGAQITFFVICKQRLDFFLKAYTCCIIIMIIYLFKVCGDHIFKAALSVTFDLLTLKIMFLFFKNTVKILKFR